MFFSGLLAAGGAVAGGVLGSSSARRQNRAIRDNAIAQQEALNENINRARFSFFDNQRVATRQHQSEQGAMTNALFSGFRSGHSLNRLLAANDNDFIADDLARKRALAQTIENFETQKTNIARSASAQTQNVTQATLMGGLQGGMAGFQLGQGIDGAIQSFQDSNFLKDLNASYAADPMNPDLQAQVMAVSSGVPPQMLQRYPNIATAPFAQRIATQNLGLQSAFSQMQFSQFLRNNAFNQLQQMAGTIGGSSILDTALGGQR
jgi:hypothetical protein